MALFKFVIIVAFMILPHKVSLLPNNSPSSNATQRCLDLFERLPFLPVIPGGGFDNIRNIPLGPVLETAYMNCLTTPDGKYLIPDNTLIVNVKKSQLDYNPEIIDSFQDYSDESCYSINLDAYGVIYGFTISGKFSDSYQIMKEHMVRTQTSVLRNSYTQKDYKVIARPGSNLDPNFKGRLTEILKYLGQNRTKTAKYLSQVLIRDYGTHVITRLDAGISISQEVNMFTSSIGTSETDRRQITASAGASFRSIAGATITYDQSDLKKWNDTYSKSTTKTEIFTLGGPTAWDLFNNKSSWSENVNLAILNRDGELLGDFINEASLPGVPLPYVYLLKQHVVNATSEYYQRNTIPGCTMIGADNFHFQANVDDGSCKMPYNSFRFAGVYQSCSVIGNAPDWRCKDFTVNNGVTGALTCPSPYVAVLLMADNYTFPPRTVSNSYKCCHTCWVVGKCCHTCTSETTYNDVVQYSTYWCADPSNSSQPNTGYLFGGFYSTVVANPFTGTMNCPHDYVTYKMGADITICLSRDYQLGLPGSVPFGGFFSPRFSGNPTRLADLKRRGLTAGTPDDSADPANAPKQCPVGYNQHLFTKTESGYEVYYCVRPSAFKGINASIPQLPPFDPMPFDDFQSTTVLVQLPDGRVWYRITQDILTWTMDQISNANTTDLMQAWSTHAAEAKKSFWKSNDGDDQKRDTNAILPIGGWIGIIVAALIVGIIFGAVIMYFRRKRSYERVGTGEST